MYAKTEVFSLSFETWNGLGQSNINIKTLRLYLY